MIGFPYPDQPWLPTLLDIEKLKAEYDGTGTDWRRFGFDALEVPEGSEVSKRMTVLNTRFIANYGWRMLSFETMEQWQAKLQEKMDSIVGKYNRAYRLYSENEEALMTDVLPGRRIVSARTDQASGSDSRSGTGKSSDTPDSMINQSDDFAGTITKNTDRTDYGRKDDSKAETVEVLTGGQLMEAINRSIDGWRDIDTSLIREFENMFVNVFWYRWWNHDKDIAQGAV